MKKRIITIIAIVLAVACLVCVLAACNSASKAIKVKSAKIKINYVEPTVFASSNVSEITELAGWNLAGGTDVLTKFSKYNATLESNTYLVYNLKTNSVIVEATTDDIVIRTSGDNACFTRSKTDLVTGKVTTTLYDMKGNVVKYKDASGADQESFVGEDEIEFEFLTSDIYEYADCYYRLDPDSDTVTFIKRKSDMSDYEYSFNATNDKYYYEMPHDEEWNLISGVFVFNKNLDLVSSYYYESNDSMVGPYFLKNGNFVIQYVFDQPDSAEEYTYISEGKKYLMKTVVVNAKNGKATEKKFDYKIRNLWANEQEEDDEVTVSKSIENIARLYPIKDQRLLTDSNDRLYVSLSNSLKVKGRLDKMIDNQTVGTDFDTIKDMLLIETKTSTKLVTTKGKVIGDVEIDASNNSYIVRNGKFYDYNLNLVYDFGKDDYTLERMLNNGAILRKENETSTDYYLYINGTDPTKLTSKSATLTVDYVSVSRYIYALKSTTLEKTTYTYYNEKGEELSGLPATVIANVYGNGRDQCYIYSASVPNATTAMNETHYYRIAK